MEYRPFLLHELEAPKKKMAPQEKPEGPAPGPDPAMLRENAEAQAQAIVEEARKQAEEIEREAYEQGFSQGEKDGREIGSMKLEKIVDRIEKVCLDLESFHRRFASLHEKEILGLIAAVAGKVVRTVVDMDRDAVKRAVMEALEGAAEWQEVTVRVAPVDFEYLEELRPEFFERMNQLRSVNIVADPAVEQGGCMVTADFGEVDATLDARLERVSQALLEAYGQRPL